MPPTLQPVLAFLGQHAPFDQLSPALRGQLARQIEIEYRKRDTLVLSPGDRVDRIFLVRSGGLREEEASGRLLAHFGEGDTVGAEALIHGQPSETLLVALEDTLLYSLSSQHFLSLCEKEPALSQFFEGRAAGRLRRATCAPPRPDSGGANLSRRVGSLISRPLVSVDAGVSIREAAAVMTRERVSCLIVKAAGSVGIVTDRDLRSRVVAVSADTDRPVSSIMTSPVVGVDIQASLLEASMQMMRLNVHHLAVFDAGAPTGVLTLTDLVQSHVANPVYFLGEIARQDTLDGLVRASHRRAAVLLQMVASDASALDTHKILTKIGDAITRRLIRIAWLELEAEGFQEPAGRYCWLAFGSQARQEHALGSDQDNALIFTDASVNADGVLTRLADRVCAGLDACGYPRCEGDIMACVERWRQPVAEWKKQFSNWIREPTKEAVMRGGIFFDLRAIHGELSLAEELAAHVLVEIGSHPLFLALLAHSSLDRRPPLGFFRQLVVESSGEHKSRLNLKHRGLIPIVDLARVYGLEAGCSDANTLVRLERAAAAGVLSETGCRELMDAYEFIGAVRLRLQARQLKHGTSVDNYLDPNELTSAERGSLRDAFSVVSTIQSSLETSRQLNLLGA